MDQIDSMTFVDRDSGDEAWLGVRAGSGLISLAVSLKENGDYHVVFSPEECERLVSILEKALLTAS